MPVSLLCLIGLPGSGKTTLAGLIRDCMAESGVRVVIIEYDLYITECAVSKWKNDRQKLLEEIHNVAFKLSGQDGSSLVILDDNFYYRSMRYEVFRIAKELRLGFGQVFLNVPFELCCLRNNSRVKPVPLDVMNRMKTLIEPPDMERNGWELRSLVLSETPRDLGRIVDLVSNTWENLNFPAPETRNPPQENSSMHYADLALRRIVKSVISATSPDRRSEITKILALKKKSILEDVKWKNISLPDCSCNGDVVSLYVRVLEPYFAALPEQVESPFVQC